MKADRKRFFTLLDVRKRFSFMDFVTLQVPHCREKNDIYNIQEMRALRW